MSNQLVKDFLREYKINNRSQETIRTYEDSLKMFFKYLEEEKNIEITDEYILRQINRNIIKDYKEYCLIDKNNSPATINSKLISLKKFYDYLVDEGLTNDNPATKIGLLEIKQKDEKFLTVQECKLLLDAVKYGKRKNEDPNRIRNILIFTILANNGLRLSEVVGLKLDHIDLENKTMTFIAKRAKTRIIPYNRLVEESLNNYLEYRKERNLCNEYLFVTTKDVHISKKQVQNLVKKYSEIAGLDNVHTHSIRHAFCSMTAQYTSAYELQKIMGHNSSRTTERYYHMTPERMREISDQNPLLED